jgi:hypothetical protein
MEESTSATNKIFEDVSHLPLSMQHILVQDIMRTEVRERMSNLPAQDKAELCQRITANITKEISGAGGKQKKLTAARVQQEKRERPQKTVLSDEEDAKAAKRPRKNSHPPILPPSPKHRCSLCKSSNHTLSKCPIVVTLKKHVEDRPKE